MHTPHLPVRRTSLAGPRRARVVLLVAAVCAAVGLSAGPSASADPHRAGPATAGAPVGRSAGDAYIYAPSSRTLAPVAVHSTSGSVTSPQNVLSGAPTRLSGAGAALVLDFGKEVGGLVTLHFAGASGSGQQLGLAFSESSLYTGPVSDLSSGTVFSGSGTDGALATTVDGAGTYTMPTDKLRGGFRYLTVFLSSSGWVDLDGVSLAFTGAAGMSDPSAYPNYFYSSDPELNRIWYAGAYTVQMDTIAPGAGRAYPPPSSGWENNAVIGAGAGVLTDGAKRDRAVWPGDLGISLPTEYASTDDVVSTKNALNSLYQHQNPSTGELEYGGPAVNFYGSDTYHTWTLIGTAIVLHVLRRQGVARLGLEQVPPRHGLHHREDRRDRAARRHRRPTTGPAATRAARTSRPTRCSTRPSPAAPPWRRPRATPPTPAPGSSRPATLKSAANQRLWNAAVGLYRDNPGSTLYPQDGNSLAVWYGLTDSPAKNTAVAHALAARWNAVGAASPEKDGGAIGTFPGSMEVQAHFAAGDDIDALTLVRREWGYMLDSPTGTGSTFWEGLRSDGSFDYGGTYMSLAHGWATGPTSALTFYLLGLAPTGTSSYDFVPHPGDLAHTEGTITLPQGAAAGSWDYDAAAGTLAEQLTAPQGTTGRIGVPTYGSSGVTVTVDGATVWSGGAFHPTAGITGGSTDGSYVYLTGVAAGNHTISATGVGSPAPFATSVERVRAAGRLHPVRHRGRKLPGGQRPGDGLRRRRVRLHGRLRGDGLRRLVLRRRRPGVRRPEILLPRPRRRAVGLHGVRRGARHLRGERHPRGRLRRERGLPVPGRHRQRRLHQRRLRDRPPLQHREELLRRPVRTARGPLDPVRGGERHLRGHRVAADRLRGRRGVLDRPFERLHDLRQRRAGRRPRLRRVQELLRVDRRTGRVTPRPARPRTPPARSAAAGPWPTGPTGTSRTRPSREGFPAPPLRSPGVIRFPEWPSPASPRPDSLPTGRSPLRPAAAPPGARGALLTGHPEPGDRMLGGILAGGPSGGGRQLQRGVGPQQPLERGGVTVDESGEYRSSSARTPGSAGSETDSGVGATSSSRARARWIGSVTAPAARSGPPVSVGWSWLIMVSLSVGAGSSAAGAAVRRLHTGRPSPDRKGIAVRRHRAIRTGAGAIR